MDFLITFSFCSLLRNVVLIMHGDEEEIRKTLSVELRNVWAGIYPYDEKKDLSKYHVLDLRGEEK